MANEDGDGNGKREKKSSTATLVYKLFFFLEIFATENKIVSRE